MRWSFALFATLVLFMSDYKGCDHHSQTTHVYYWFTLSFVWNLQKKLMWCALRENERNGAKNPDNSLMKPPLELWDWPIPHTVLKHPRSVSFSRQKLIFKHLKILIFSCLFTLLSVVCLLFWLLFVYFLSAGFFVSWSSSVFC